MAPAFFLLRGPSAETCHGEQALDAAEKRSHNEAATASGLRVDFRSGFGKLRRLLFQSLFDCFRVR